MKILVTGAAGFIGFHLCKSLLERGHTVVGIDNINSYYDINLKYKRLNILGIDRDTVGDGLKVDSSLYPNFVFIKEDIVNHQGLREIFSENKFDKVCNLAAQAGVRYSFENPQAYIQSNIVGFVNIIELSREFAVKHFIYASSSSVYGNRHNTPFKEDDRTDEPQSIYAATKKSNELIAHTYGSQLNLPVTGLRFFTVYGYLGRPDMSPVLFAEAIKKGETIKVFNNGDMSRDFSYVGDVVEGITKIIESEPKKKIGIYNIGNSKPIHLMDFIGTIEKHLQKKAKKDFLPMQKGDVYTTYADTGLLNIDYGYKPNTSIEEGIKESIKE